jgi:hypothetical protein
VLGRVALDGGRVERWLKFIAYENRLANQPVARTVAYYLVLAAGVAILYQVDPGLPGVFNTGSFHALGASESALRERTPLVGTVSALEVVWEALIAMVGAYLLMLPVSWVYIYTRRKRGYQQSVVQTLILLPIVAAGVVLLVKSSIELAFGLAGIVAAIKFRSQLDDTKDSVTVLLGIGVGVAAGVQVMGVAALLSIFYNLINLILWWTDFGRLPGQLEGPAATRRLQEARNRAGAPGAFVSRVDTMILKSMTPEQLEVLTERARRRQRNLAHQIEVPALEPDAKAKKFDARLRIVLESGDLAPLRRQIETVLEQQTKRWQFDSAQSANGGRQSLVYQIKSKKSVAVPLLVEAVRRAVLGRAVTVDVT